MQVVFVIPKRRPIQLISHVGEVKHSRTEPGSRTGEKFDHAAVCSSSSTMEENGDGIARRGEIGSAAALHKRKNTKKSTRKKKHAEREREKKREENESVLNEIDRKRQHVQQVIFESLA